VLCIFVISMMVQVLDKKAASSYFLNLGGDGK